VRPSRRRAAFTLIEVLVVVAIIALLIAILVPSLTVARRRTRETACASQLHQIGIGLVLYQQTYKAFPPQAMINVDQTTGVGQAFGLWSLSIHRAVNKLLKTGFKNSTDADQVRSSEMFYCPSVRDSDRVGDILGTDQVDEDAPPYLHITYAYLGRLDAASNDPALPRGYLGESAPRDVPISRKFYVKKDADGRRVLMSDMLMFWGGAATTHGAARWRINHGPQYGPYSEGQRLTLYGSNLAYGDGHVEWKNPGKFPKEFRYSANWQELRRSAQLIRDSDFFWW